MITIHIKGDEHQKPRDFLALVIFAKLTNFMFSYFTKWELTPRTPVKFKKVEITQRKRNQNRKYLHWFLRRLHTSKWVQLSKTAVENLLEPSL